MKWDLHDHSPLGERVRRTELQDRRMTFGKTISLRRLAQCIALLSPAGTVKLPDRGSIDSGDVR